VFRKLLSHHIRIAKSKGASLHPNIRLGPLLPPKHSQVCLKVEQLPYQLCVGGAHFTLFTKILISNERLSYNDSCLRICIAKSSKESGESMSIVQSRGVSTSLDHK